MFVHRIARGLVVGALGLVLAFVPGCIGVLPDVGGGEPGGTLAVRFDFSGARAAREISDDFALVASGKAFLKQGGVEKVQGSVVIEGLSGTCTLTSIPVGSYDVVLELYDSSPKVLYDATSTVNIVAGDNGVKQMTLEKYIGTLSISGSWTEGVTGLASATAELREGQDTVYGTSLSVNVTDKTVSGGLINVYPGSYELYVAVKNSSGGVEFEGTKSLSISKGPNPTAISLLPKTGSIQIQVGGDVIAPVILSGPSYTVSGTDVTVSWTTDENATSAVCYSSTPSFNYQSSLNWAPAGGDLTADATSHGVTITGLTHGATYYYVVVSSDSSGNLKVSDEQSLDVLPFGYVTQWGSFGTGNGQFDTPCGIAIGADGSIYVSEVNNHRLQKFDSVGNHLTTWGGRGPAQSQFQFPQFIAADVAGNIYVADNTNHRIQKFDPNGGFLLQWGQPGAGEAQFNQPVGVAVDAAGNVYVTDWKNYRIQKFTQAGVYMTEWGTSGTGTGEFRYPFGLAVDSSGAVYASDVEDNRVQKFAPDGTYLLQWGSIGTGDGQFDQPAGVAVDSADRVFVVDHNNHRIQVFDSSGNYLTQWGGPGSGDGQFGQPNSVVIGANGDVYVTDQNNHRVQQFVSRLP